MHIKAVYIIAKTWNNLNTNNEENNKLIIWSSLYDQVIYNIYTHMHIYMWIYIYISILLMIKAIHAFLYFPHFR